MNSINLPNEYIMQMYVNALAKKGVDKVLLLETLNEVNEVTSKFLAMANDEITKGGEKQKKAKKQPIVEKKQESEDDVATSNKKDLVQELFDDVSESESENETKNESKNDKESSKTCAFEYKGGKNKGSKCGKPVEKDSDYCAGHNKKTSDKKKKEVKVLSDTEENNANQVVAKTKVPCEFKLTAGKNKGKACGKVGCKAHTGILPVHP
jgi:hypothetical protein